MNIVRIGSAALHTYIPSLVIGLDIDYIMVYSDFKKWVKTLDGLTSFYPINHGKTYVVNAGQHKYEISIAWPDSTSEEFMNLVMNDEDSTNFQDSTAMYWTPSLTALYTMKMSHRYLRNSPHFLKTMQHINLMRHQWSSENNSIISVTPYWSDWYKRRMDETYWYAHPDLTVKKGEFFKDETFYKYDHDDIHVAVKLGDVPAYTRIVADGEQVKCDRKKFDKLSFENKLHCALEECYVLALERSLIPNEFGPDPKKAFEMALMKVCSSITSGWFREWCWEHYSLIMCNYSKSFVKKFLDSLAYGKVRPFSHDRLY